MAIAGEAPSNEDMIQDLSQLIPALAAAKKSLSAPEPRTRDQRLQDLSRLADLWGSDATDAEVDALARESGLSQDLVKSWDLRATAEYLRRFVAANSVLKTSTEPSRVPRGVVVLLQPRFHGPRLFVERFAPAYLAGNPVLVKMSSKTPSASQWADRWLRAAGIPEEAANVVAGPSSSYSGILVQHPAIAAVSGVGRREVMLNLYREVAGQGRAFQGFTGGRATMLVLDVWDAPTWKSHLTEALRDGRGQRPYDILRIFVLEKDENVQRTAVEEALREFPDAQLRDHLTQCSEDHQAEALGPVVLFSTIKYPFDLAKWINNAPTGFAAALFGPEDRLRKIAPRLEVGLVTAHRGFDPAENLLFGMKESVLGDVDLSPNGSFFSQGRQWLGLAPAMDSPD